MQKFLGITIFGLIIMVGTYALAFSGFISSSETDLVRYSYFWVPVLFFGLSGMYAVKRQFKNDTKIAILGAIGSLLLLAGFYEAIWPLL